MKKSNKILFIIAAILCVMTLILPGCTGKVPVGKVGTSTTPRVFTSQPTSQDFVVAGDIWISGNTTRIFNGSLWTIIGTASGTANITSANYTIVAHGLGGTPATILLSWAGAPVAASLYTLPTTNNATSFTIYSTVNQTNTTVSWRAFLNANP